MADFLPRRERARGEAGRKTKTSASLFLGALAVPSSFGFLLQRVAISPRQTDDRVALGQMPLLGLPDDIWMQHILPYIIASDVADAIARGHSEIRQTGADPNRLHAYERFCARHTEMGSTDHLALMWRYAVCNMYGINPDADRRLDPRAYAPPMPRLANWAACRQVSRGFLKATLRFSRDVRLSKVHGLPCVLVSPPLLAIAGIGARGITHGEDDIDDPAVADIKRRMEEDTSAFLDNGYVDTRGEYLHLWVDRMTDAQARVHSHAIASQLEAECETTINHRCLDARWSKRVKGLYQTWMIRSLIFPVSYIHFEGDPIERVLRNPETYLARVGYYVARVSPATKECTESQDLLEPHTLVSDFRPENMHSLPLEQDEEGEFRPTRFSSGINHLTDVQLLRSPLHRYVWGHHLSHTLGNPESLVGAITTVKRLAVKGACTLSVLQPPIQMGPSVLGTMHSHATSIGSAPNVKHLRLHPSRPTGTLCHLVGAKKLTSRLRLWDDVTTFVADELQQSIWKMLPGLTHVEYCGRVAVIDALAIVRRRLASTKSPRPSDRRALVPHVLEVAEGANDEHAGTWFWHNAPPGLKTITFKSHVDATQDEEVLMHYASGAPPGVTLEYVMVAPVETRDIPQCTNSVLRASSTAIRYRGSREMKTRADVRLVCARLLDSCIPMPGSVHAHDARDIRYMPSRMQGPSV